MTLTLVQRKGLTARDTLVKYERSTSYHSKDMANAKFFCRQTHRQADRGQKSLCPQSMNAVYIDCLAKRVYGICSYNNNSKT